MATFGVKEQKKQQLSNKWWLNVLNKQVAQVMVAHAINTYNQTDFHPQIAY